jgi:hypothetical protein
VEFQEEQFICVYDKKRKTLVTAMPLDYDPKAQEQLNKKEKEKEELKIKKNEFYNKYRPKFKDEIPTKSEIVDFLWNYKQEIEKQSQQTKKGK